MDKAEALRRILDGLREVAPGQDYQVDLFRPEDGPGVARLFYAVYGESYPVDDYYIPERIERANQAGDLRTVVARLDNGDILGQGALYRSSPPNPGLFELGQMLVLPAYRESFVAFKMANLIRDRLFGAPGVDGVFGEAVCYRLVTQKLCARLGMLPCGMEIALMPEGAYAGEGAPGRVSCLVMARVDRDRRRPAYLPEAYREELTFVLSGLGLDREVVFASGAGQVTGATALRSKIFDGASVLRCQASAIGGDFADKAAEAEAQAGKPAVVQFFLNAEDPAAPAAVMALREQGYFLGGLIPIWFGGDAVLMQKLRVAPEFDSVLLHGERAEAIFDRVRTDRERAARA